MKKMAITAIITALISGLLIFPGTLFALEKLSDAELKGVHAQSGISVAVESVPLFYNADSFKFTAVDNVDRFGNPTPYEGYVALENHEVFFELDGEFHMDIGAYYAPDEHLFAADIAKRTVNPGMNEHWYVGYRTPGLETTEHLQPDPYYWTIGDDIPRPLDNRITGLHVTTSNLISSFTSTSGIKFCDLDLSNMSLSGITMPEFIHDGVSLPGIDMTVFPGMTNGINAEIRTRLTIDEFKLHRDGYSADPDFSISGIHLGEAFGQVLPNHLEDTGGTSGALIDTSGWGSDFTERMHRGYFLLGNLNQIDYADNINEQELCYHSGATHNDKDGALNLDPVQLVAAPLSINFVTRDDRSFISLSTGLEGSIRIESFKGWDGSEFGPLAVDGLRIKHCVIEFPGGYTRDGNLKAQIHPAQLDWLNNLLVE